MKRKVFGDFEQVNGAIANALQDEIELLNGFIHEGLKERVCHVCHGEKVLRGVDSKTGDYDIPCTTCKDGKLPPTHAIAPIDEPTEKMIVAGAMAMMSTMPEGEVVTAAIYGQPKDIFIAMMRAMIEASKPLELELKTKSKLME